MDKLLHKLSGFQKLNQNQKRVILETLEIQKNAEQGDADAINIINEWYCHASALAVEIGDFNPKILKSIPKDYQKCEGKSLLWCPNQLVLQNFLSEFEAPFVLHMLVQYSKDYIVYHSLISLGQLNNMHYIWEKRGAGSPFMITSAENLFQEFPKYGWGKRHFVYDQI